MTPGSTTRRSTHAASRPLRVTGWRPTEIVGSIPIAAPDVHQIPHIMESIAIGGILANEIRRFEGLTSAIGIHPLRQVVPPGISLPVATTPRGLFPFSLRGETIRLATDIPQPGTVG